MNYKSIVKKYRKKYPEIKTFSELARKIIQDEGLKISHRNLRRRVSEHWDVINVGEDKEEKKWDEKKDSALFEYSGTKKIDNFRDALEYCGVDLNTWEVERKVFNSWDVTMKIKENGIETPATRTNYQFKLWFRRKRYGLEDFRTDLLRSIADVAPVHKKRWKPTKTGYALELDVFDPHIGKLAWGKETGEDYDVKIAKDRYLHAVEDLINKASGYNIERIIYPIGNDYLHYDNLDVTTTKGTQLDSDVRWQKMFIEGEMIGFESINMIQKEFGVPVDVIVLPGNHDAQATFYLGEVLKQYYRNDVNVNINNEPRSRKYYKWGKVGLMYTHGDESRWMDFPLIMLRDNMKEWADVEFMEVHCGHFHKTKKVEHVTAEEKQGIVVRVLRSIAGTDAWHYKSGFTNNIKGAEGFIWNKEHGMEANIKSNIL